MNRNANDAHKQLTVVIAPASDHESALDLRSLFDYLSEKIKIPIHIKFCQTYTETIEALSNDKADIGWLGPFAYLKASREGILDSFAVGIPKGKNSPNYHSIIISRQRSPIKKIEDIRNRRIAIGDRHSASGFIIPERELGEAGMSLSRPENFKEIVVTKNHDEAIRFLGEGRVDVAAVSSVNFEENIRENKIKRSAFQIIHISQDIPGAPLVFTKKLNENLKLKIKNLVLNAHKEIDVGGYGGKMDRYIDPAEGKIKLLESYLQPQWGWRTKASLIAGLIVTFLIMLDLDINPFQLASTASNYLVDVVSRMMPPDFSNFSTLAKSMFETIEIAFLGTLLAILLSIPIGLFSARNFAPNLTLFYFCRAITVFFRAIPEFIIAMILVIAVGFGAVPGIVALGFHTMGFLAKFYAEAIEHVNTGPMEALESMGASRMQVLSFSIVPQILPSFVGNNMYILDRNIRMATMLGIVGAGGIGYQLQSSFRMFEYQEVSAIIIMIFFTIFIIDIISSYIRRKFL